MQTGGYTQSGGFDPGLTALIAALLSGGVGAYGYSKESRSTEDMAAERLKVEYEEKLKRAATKEAENASLKAEQGSIESKLSKIEMERNQLKQALDALKAKVDTDSGPALVFQSASAQTLKDAIPLVIAALEVKYPNLVKTAGDKAKISKVLEYPTTYQAKLARLTLPAFYSKQVELVLQQIAGKATGGRRRRRGGTLEEDIAGATVPGTAEGSPASYAQSPSAVESATVPGTAEGSSAPPVSSSKPIPSYDEFASIYEKAIRDATSTARSREDKRQEGVRATVDEGVRAKKDAAAVRAQQKKDDAAAKAATAVIPKFESAIQEGQKAIDDNAALVGILSAERQATIAEKKRELLDALQAARELIGMPDVQAAKKKRFGLFGGAATLREVKTESEWTEMNTPTKAVDLLQKVKDATKAFVQEVKTLSKEEKKSFDVPKVEFGLPKIPVPSPSNPFAPIAKRIGEANTAADQAAIVRKETKNAVLFMKDILKKVDIALKEVTLSTKATARRNRKKGGAVDPDAFKPRREMPDYASLGIQALAANLKAVAKGGKEEVGGKTFDWSEKPDGELHPLSFYLAQLNTSVFSGTVDLFLAATTGKSREFSRDVFIAAGEQYALVRTYLEDVVKGLKNPELTRATRLERLAIGAEEGVGAVASLVDGMMGLVKKASAALVGAMPGAPVPLAVATDIQAKINELVAKHGPKRVKLVLGRLKSKIPSLPVENQAKMSAIIAAGEKAVREAEALNDSGIEMMPITPPASTEEVEAVNAAVDEASARIAPLEIEPGQGDVPMGEFPNVGPVTPTSDPVPESPVELPPAASPDEGIEMTPLPKVEDPGITRARSILSGAESLTRREKLAAIQDAEDALKTVSGQVRAQRPIREEIIRLRRTVGGRRRKARKSTLKKRRGGK